ncbi:C4-dicarboxylate ABC transporter substrate-binding protein [Sporanaerobium hydrogeniformans]|uniref:C4-dicarboxylate ABC transporter substrate-binding protein n=1 Tax=Sporanaerobium hydrogeniformans TaxID=3072179 RepID=A0AC61D9V1_9FIRM|nr:C4-dicarboxylate TRAP transporter substrate-binding protein [Sporanaerobium hydrogeniformans]PHV70081.1 C4-dicarboxylate ABC transporter substrate-binding protein [Sporanaerobium hydrogeniformans]
MKKNFLLGILALTMSLSTLVGCGGTTQNPNTSTPEAPTQTSNNAEAGNTTPTANKEAVIVQIGFENTLDEPIGQALTKWKELVAEKGDGSLEIKLFPNSSLGSKTELIDMMVMGEPVVTIADGAFYADYGVKDMGIMYGPFFFESWDDVWTLIESDWYADQSKKLEEKGLKLLASNWIYGSRHLMTTKKVVTPEDVAGMKIRVAATEIYMEGWNSLGAVATGLALGETYQALQTGVVEGVENPFSTLYGQSFHEVAKNILLTGHIKNFTTWVTGTEFFNQLTPEQQELLVTTGEEAGLYNNQLQTENEQVYLDQLTSAGVTVTEMTEENLAAWKEKSKGFYELGDKFGWSEGLYDTVQKAMGK